MSSKTQTALALTEIGKPLTKITVPVPSPGDNEALIKITACGLNPFDQKARDRNVFNIANHLPAVLGFDLAGTVVSNGPNSTLPIGAHVFCQGGFSSVKQGGLQEYTVIDSRYAAIVPSNISDSEATIFPCNGLTSAIALFGKKMGFGFPFPGTPESQDFDFKGKKVVIIGGGTNCGKFGIQFAKLVGIGRIIVIASTDDQSKVEELKRYGATDIIDRKLSNQDLERKIREEIVGDELEYVLDCFNPEKGHDLAVSLLSNHKKGTFVHLLRGEVDEVVARRKMEGWDDRHIFGSPEGDPAVAELFTSVLPTWILEGKIQMLPFREIRGLDERAINEALDSLRAGAGSVGGQWHVVY